MPAGAKFCVMCGFRVEAEAGAAYGTSTLTGSGLIVSLATAAIAAGIVTGIVVLVESFV